MRPKLLDLFCGAGGASMGYYRAGFDVTGVDIRSQPRYPFRFVQSDALQPPFDLRDFDVVHASPPCQKFTVAQNFRGNADKHPDLIEPTRKMLEASGRLWVMENVVGAPLVGTQICGLGVGLGVRRHRVFESNVLLFGVPCVDDRNYDYYKVFGHEAQRRKAPRGNDLAGAKEAMGIDWMTHAEMSEAIPPAYTEHLGDQLRMLV